MPGFKLNGAELMQIKAVPSHPLYERRMKRCLSLLAALIALAGVGCDKPMVATQAAPAKVTYEVRGFFREISPRAAGPIRTLPNTSMPWQFSINDRIAALIKV